MASVLNKTNAHNDDDEEDLEALRLAALMTLRKKPAAPPPLSSSVTFQPHFGNPNLIAIIPEGAEPVRPKHLARQNFFRHHPHPGPRGPHQQYRPQGTVTSTLKVLPQVPLEGDKKSTTEERKELGDNQEKEEVSTKFSRFEDTESESEDESENEKKESDGSSDESDDVLALQDDDDSLEALMAQMEHEIEVGIDPEPNKKEKKKPKNNKFKEKESKNKTDEKNILLPEKSKAETKTAIVEPTLKDADVEKVITQERAKSPVKIHPINVNISAKNWGTEPQNKQSLIVRGSGSPPQLQSNQRALTPPSRSPQREKSPATRTVPRRSTSRSRSRSPILRATSPSRRKSPRRLTPDKKSSDRYYSAKRSTSPYYKSREQDYVNRSHSPIRRRSLSPRRSAREASPRYYQRRSRSPWSSGYRHSPESPVRYRSPVHRRSMSPKKKYSKPRYSPYSPSYHPHSPRRKSPSLSPRRSKSPPRKQEYSPQRRRSPRREFNYRRNSLSPKRKHSPLPKKYSPQRSPRRIQRSPSVRRNVSPRRRNSPMAIKGNQSKSEQRSRTPSLSLSPSPPRETKGQDRRYKSPLCPRREVADVRSNRTARVRRPYSPEKLGDGEIKDKLKSNNKVWERKMEAKRKERGDRTGRDVRKDREKVEEHNEERSKLKVTNNPLFEARRKKFESTALVEPASKKIRLVSKISPVKEKATDEKKQELPVVEKKIVEHSVQTEDDLFSGQDELDEIDNFLNEDVLDLSAEVWDSDDDLLPKVNNASTKKTTIMAKSKQKTAKERSALKDKGEKRKAAAAPEIVSVPEKKVTRSQSPQTPIVEASPEPEHEESDLRAELSRRREERLTKAGSLHEKLPARLLQSAFESALGKKKVKKEEKLPKTEKENKKRDKSPPAHKEKGDGRRVLVLKRTAPVKMQSAHINVTFPSRSVDYRTNADSDSESSYSSSSSSSEEERYSAPKRKLPVYMRLGTTTHKHSDGRKVKLHSRRSQLPFLKIPIPLRMCTLVSDHYV